ncbi:tetratricopeptide repeat protein [Oceanispirochaeta sp.]|jgi:tetratricopeptide (TPR) repeat protein|uniref:tetratricopeptide repeat protein n=1 Tax=Oceanispirochaeta sp. TaxID=2035350 RepID=UPI00263492DE|nr:tetratricopeptide repeat protein [Oceanispirochaeta sp.]MDA3955537.1 tetratricopeptide repeat protein [Oceanispirochaeta sp.]
MQKLNKLIIILFLFSSVFLQAQTLDLYQDGQNALRRGDYYSSLDLFKQALSVNPFYVDARKGMAEAYFLLQEYSEALTHAQMALKGADKRVDLLTLTGRIYLGLNRMEDAELHFQKALAIEPNNTEAAYGKAEIAVFQGNYSEGTDLFERSLAVNPDSRRALLSLSLLYEETAETDRSLFYLNKALEYYPQDPSVMDFAIRHYSRNGNWGKAEALALKWQALNPENRSIPILLGTIYNRMDRYEDAVFNFKKAVSFQQADPLVWYLLGRSFMGMGEFDEALLSFRTVEIIDPGDELSRIAMEHLLLKEYPIGHEERIKAGKYHFALGKSFEKSFQYLQAFNEYRIGRLLSPLDLEGWWNYAAIQNSLGYPNRYRDEMLALKREGFDNKTYLRVLELLESSEDLSILNNWKTPLIRSFNPVSISLYFNKEESSLIHSGMEDALMVSVSNQLNRNSHYEIRSMETIENSADAYRKSHLMDSNFYVVLSVSETERTIGLSCSIHLSRTGALLHRFHILRSGNRRVNDILFKSAENILLTLPLKGSVMGIDEKQVLLNLGLSDALEKDSEFILLRKDSERWTDKPPYLEFSIDDLLGTVVLTKLQENYSLGTLQRNSPFDLVNAGDEIFMLTEDMALPDSYGPPVNEELKSQLLKLY